MTFMSLERSPSSKKILVGLVLVLLLPVSLVAIFLYLLWGIILYAAIWLVWPRRLVLFVYSDSPNWKEYLELKIVPNLQGKAIILNWSERKTWKHSLPILAFRYFGGHRNFNPMALIFRPFRFVQDYRFYEAFKEFKHDKPDKVEDVVRALLDDIEP